MKDIVIKNQTVRPHIYSDEPGSQIPQAKTRHAISIGLGIIGSGRSRGDCTGNLAPLWHIENGNIIASLCKIKRPAEDENKLAWGNNTDKGEYVYEVDVLVRMQNLGPKTNFSSNGAQHHDNSEASIQVVSKLLEML
jgi:hypothetical protein